jgi:hypothetical protein
MLSGSVLQFESVKIRIGELQVSPGAETEIDRVEDSRLTGIARAN